MTTAAKKGTGRRRAASGGDDASVLVPRPTRRPMLYNRVQAAAELGICHDVLQKLAAAEGRIFQPAAVLNRINLYTELQIEFISYVLLKRMTAEAAYTLWRAIENREISDLMRRGGIDPGGRRRERNAGSDGSGTSE